MNTQNLLYPGYSLLISIISAITLGTILLMLPISQVASVSFIDCLFASVASTCVAGCLTVPFQSFSLFGQIVILILIQIGGIGLITLSLFLVSLFKKLGYRTQLMIGQILEFDSWKSTKPMLMFIIFFTFIAEILGAIGIFLSLDPTKYSFKHAIFHSISSFCSAGLSCFESSELVEFSLNFPFLLFTGLLIIFGTFGFITWLEIFHYFKNIINSKRAILSLSTQIILILSAILIAIFTCFLLFTENGQLVGQPGYVKLYNMLFNAISYRSTGFSTLVLSEMKIVTLFLILIYSFIGSAPGSTGSGIKITTFGIFLATLRAILSGKMIVEIKERRIMQEQIFNTMAIIYLSFTWILLMTFALLLIETNYSFFDIFFETISSFTTLGMGMDLTPTFSVWGKLLIILNIFVGRVGVLIVLLALKSYKESEFNYPEERILIT